MDRMNINAKGSADGRAVQILENLFGPQTNRYQRALTLATERHSLLTNNLANVSTPGYKRRDMDFNLTLTEAMGEVDHAKQFSQEAAAQSPNPNSLRNDGNNVDMEREVMAMAETELRYQAVTDMAANYFAGMKNVIREGK